MPMPSGSVNCCATPAPVTSSTHVAAQRGHRTHPHLTGCAGMSAAGGRIIARRRRVRAGEDFGRGEGQQAAAAEQAAVHALCGGSQDDYGSCLQQLANERTPGWTRAVSRSLVEVLRLSVTAAWRRGWQPAEL